LAEVIKPSRRDSLQIKPQKHKANFWQFLEKERKIRGGIWEHRKGKRLRGRHTHAYTKTERRIIISENGIV
jgi:hypothetical protein